MCCSESGERYGKLQVCMPSRYVFRPTFSHHPVSASLGEDCSKYYSSSPRKVIRCQLLRLPLSVNETLSLIYELCLLSPDLLNSAQRHSDRIAPRPGVEQTERHVDNNRGIHCWRYSSLRSRHSNPQLRDRKDSLAASGRIAVEKGSGPALQGRVAWSGSDFQE